MDAVISIWRMIEHLFDRVTSILTAVAFTASFLMALWSMCRWAKERWYRWFAIPPGACVTFVLMGWWWTIVLPHMFGYQVNWSPGRVGLPHTKPERESIEHFLASLNLHNASTELFNTTLARAERKPGSPFIAVSREQQQAVTKLLKDSLRESKLVDDRVLTKLQPDLATHYREEFCQGSQLLLEGMLSADTSSDVKGQMLLDRWGDWYVAHRQELEWAL